MKYVASKLSFDQSFEFHKGGRAPYVTVKKIVVKGKSNVRDPKTFVMPDGVITEVTDEDAALIAADPLYKQYEQNGMMKLVSSKAGARSAKEDLGDKDGAAQLTAEDYTKRGLKPPTAVKEADDEGDDDGDDGSED